MKVGKKSPIGVPRACQRWDRPLHRTRLWCLRSARVWRAQQGRGMRARIQNPHPESPRSARSQWLAARSSAVPAWLCLCKVFGSGGCHKGRADMATAAAEGEGMARAGEYSARSCAPNRRKCAEKQGRGCGRSQACHREWCPLLPERRRDVQSVLWH